MTSSNAIAGPSTLPDTIPPFLPPVPGPSRPPPYFTSTDDLLARFHLVPAYDKYVRPFVDDAIPDKGKGKERDLSPTPEPTSAPGVDPEDDDNDKRKKKNNYRHLIKGVPGKHSMKKDEYLTTIMQVPPKQRIPITQFDHKTQRDAFSMSLDGLKGWNINTLVAESPQAREDRRKRKELKRLAKAGIPFPLSAAAPTPAASTNAPTPAATHAVSTPVPARVGTPKPIVAQTGSRPPIPAPAGTGEAPRGKKREHEDSAVAANAAAAKQPPPTSATNPNAPATPMNGSAATTAMANAKVGANGVRPRPLKKQRMDLQGQGRDVAVVQPTPQGV